MAQKKKEAYPIIRDDAKTDLDFYLEGIGDFKNCDIDDLDKFLVNDEVEAARAKDQDKGSSKEEKKIKKKKKEKNDGKKDERYRIGFTLTQSDFVALKLLSIADKKPMTELIAEVVTSFIHKEKKRVLDDLL